MALSSRSNPMLCRVIYAFLRECELLNEDYEQRFPGMKATDIGIQYDRRAAETMKHWYK